MMIYVAIFCAVAGVGPVEAKVPQRTLPYMNVPAHGTLFRGKLFGFFGTADQKSKISIPEYDLWAIPLADSEPKKWEEYFINGDFFRFGLRHHVGHDCVWIMREPGTLCRLKIEELRLFNLSNPNWEKHYREKYPRAGTFPPYELHHSFPLQTLSMKQSTNPVGFPEPKKIPGFGAVPTSSTSCRSYILYGEAKTIVTWDSDFLWSEKETRWMPKPSPGFAKIDHWIKDLDSGGFQKRMRAVAELQQLGQAARPSLEKFIASKPSVDARRLAGELLEKSVHAPYMGAEDYNYEKFSSLFVEDFHFFLRKNDYYFVTQSGELYIAPPPKKGEKSRTMTALWDDKTRPIVGIIEDADNDKVWLFAQNKKDAKLGYYFEMLPRTSFETFDPTKLTPVNAGGRAKKLLEYLPLIRAEGKKGRGKGS